MRKALLIGNNKYPTKPLSVCLNDVDLMQSMLYTNPDGSQNFVVTSMKDEKSAQVAFNAIASLFKDPCDCALFYFSGHGGINGDKFCICFAGEDAKGTNSRINLDDILKLVVQSPAKQKIVILDSCCSGGMGQVNKVNPVSVLSENTTILTACKGSEQAKCGTNYSLFTEILCHALNGAAAAYDGSISITGVYGYIERYFKPGEQRPLFKTNTSEAVILKTVIPLVPKDIIIRTLLLFADENSEYNLDPSYEPTNYEGSEDRHLEPYASFDHTAIFADLQALEGIGLVVPTNEAHMYFAAMKSKSCHLTQEGKYCWRLLQKKQL